LMRCRSSEPQMFCPGNSKEQEDGIRSDANRGAERRETTVDLVYRRHAQEGAGCREDTEQAVRGPVCAKRFE
jgi:hypothetical protein